jgi:hypothetical protein
LIPEIPKQVDLFDVKEVYNEALFYKSRIEKIIPALEPVPFELFINPQSGSDEVIGQRPATPDRQRELMQRFKEELRGHLHTLDLIIEARKPFAGSAIPDTESRPVQPLQNVIWLPENFTVSEVNKHFTPQLSVNQAALFLYYLREQAILPPYSDASIGKLAEAFFVRNQKNITKSLTDIHSVKHNKEELMALKRVLEALLKEVENDIKKAS